MEPHSYIYEVAALSGMRALVLRTNRTYSKPNLLQLWDLASGELLLEVSAQAQLASLLAADDAVAVTGDSQGFLRVWSLPDGTCTRVIDTRGDTRSDSRGVSVKGSRDRTHFPVLAITLLDAGRRALVATGDGNFGVWELDSGERVRDFGQQGLFVDGFSVLRAAREFLCATMDRSVQLWDSGSCRCLRTFLEPGLPPFKPHLDARDPECPTAVCVMHDDQRAVSSHGDGTLRCWDLQTGALLHKVRTSNAAAAWLTAVSASAQANLVIVGGWDQNVWWWEPGGEPVAMSGHVGEVTGVQFLPGSELAVSVSFDQTIRIWDILRRSCVRVIGKPVPSSQCPPNESRW